MGVLVAVSIPIFTTQLNKAKDATNLANARSYYAQLVADYLDDNELAATPSEWDGTDNETITYEGNSYQFTKVGSASLSVDTTDNPVVTYTDFEGNDHVFGGSN